MTRRVMGLFALAALAGCGDRTVAFDLSGVALDHGQVVVLGPDGAVVARSEPFRRAGPAGPVAPLPKVVLPAGVDGAAWLVALDAAALPALEPRFDPGAAEAVVVESADAPPPEPDRVAVALPATTRVHRLEPGGGAPSPAVTAGAAGLAGRLRLSLRVRPPECGPPPGFTGFAPWHADGLEPLADLRRRDDPSDRAPRFVGLTRVGPDRLLLATGEEVFLLRRDRAPDPGRPPGAQERVPREALLRPGQEDLRIAALAVAPPGDRPEAPREVLVALTNSPPLGPDPTWRARGVLARLWLGPDGLSVDPASPLFEADDARLQAVAIDADGRAVVTGDPGLAALRPSASAAFGAPVRLRSREADDSRVALATGDAEHPLVVATQARLHRWRASAGRWVSTEVLAVAPLRTFAVRGLAMGREPGGEPVLWASGWSGFLASLGPRGWRQEPFLTYPPGALGECPGAVSVGDAQRYVREINGVGVAGDRLVALIGNCGGVTLMRVADRCVHHTALVPPVQVGAAPPLVDLEVASSTAAGGRHEAVVLGEDGALWEARWGE
jgi:hypothetical protein